MSSSPSLVEPQEKAPGPANGQALRVLIVEDTESDLKLVLRALRRGGYEPSFERVESAAGMRAALSRQAWDLVLSDYVLPGFGGLEALKIAKSSGLDLPFILVSNKVSEEVLVEAMRAGAMDFVMKDRLERLGPVVKRELADAAARASAKHAHLEWRSVLDSVQDAIFVHDAEFRIVRANLTYVALAQMPIQDAIGKPYWEVFPRASGPLPGCKGVCVREAGKAEEEVRLDTGEVYLSRSFPITSAAGYEGHFLHVLQDVTERNRVRDAVETSEKRFRALMQHASDVVALVDPQGAITYASPSAKQVLGYAADELQGRQLGDFIHPGDGAAVEGGLAETTINHLAVHTVDIRFRRKDGRWIVLEVVARNALGDSLLNGIVINARDVTERVRNTELLQTAESRYRAIFAESRDGIVLVDAESGLVAECNAEFERQTGRRVAELQKLHIWELRAPELQERAREKFYAIKTTGTGASADFPLQRPDGSLVPVDFAAKLVRLGERTFVQSSSRDISERKRAETALRRSEKRHRQLFESSRDALMTMAPPSWRYASANWATLELFGVDNTEAFTRLGPVEISPERQPDGRRSDEKSQEMIAIALREGKHLFEWTHRRLDGRSFPADVLLTRMELGGEVFLQATVRDITRRRDAQEALRAAEQQFRSLVEQSIAGIYIIQDRKFAYVNPRFAEIRGFGSADEVIGLDPLSLVAEKDRAAIAEHNRRVFAGEAKTYSHSFTALRKDGSSVEVGVQGTVATFRGRPAIIGMLQDISEKKRADEEIQRYVAKLQIAFMSSVEVATNISEMRDPYTAGHERRVAKIAVAIGAELGFDASRQEGLQVAGQLHDIGKITVPAEILSKPGKLSGPEFEIIQGHAQAGYDILKRVEFPWPVAQVALQHHERLDGSGYPQGLKGDAILFEARVLAVADTVEAMISYRPYRPGLGIDMALAEIERGRGTVYDVAVADACLRLFRDKGYRLPE